VVTIGVACVSGSVSTAHPSTAALASAINRKIASQPKAVSRMPPTIGASIGAITMAVVTSPIMPAARSRSSKSRMMARPITMPVEAPAACTMRAAISAPIEAANSAPNEATTDSASPASTTGRRPKRSDKGPSTSCALARLKG
jgi:hypothetical protein